MNKLWHWFYWTFAAINIVFTLFGYYSIFLFILMLLSFCGIAYRFVKNKRTEVGMLIILIAVIVFAAELIMRSKHNLQSYPEANGSWLYQSPFDYYPNTKGGWVYTRTPNSTKQEDRGEYYYRVSTNNDGLRDIQHELSKANGQFRILALGGSFTEGIGVSEIEETWTKILEKNLNDQSEDLNIEVFNAGVAGSDPFYELVLLKERLLKYDPDLVILTIDESDIDDIYIRGGQERFNPDSTVSYRAGPWYEPLFGMSYLARLFIFKVSKIDWLFRSPMEIALSFDNANNLILECISEFETLATKEGFQLMVVLQPDYYELEGDKFTLAQLGLQLSKRQNTSLYNAWSDIKSYPDRSLLFWPLDRHFTKKGNEVFASLLQSEIINYNFIRKESKNEE